MKDTPVLIKRIKRYGSINIVLFLLLAWILVSFYMHDNHSSVIDFVSDLKLRSVVLVFFYLAVSWISFHFYSKVSCFVVLIGLLLFSLKEAYAGSVQLYQGAPYPVGTLLNPNIFACLLSVTCSILAVVVSQLRKRLLRVPLYLILGWFVVLMILAKSRLAFLSLVVPVICFFSLDQRYSGFIRKHMLIISIVLTASFVVLYFLKKPSADGRLYMARIATRIIKHNDIWGVGSEGFAGAFGYEQYRYFSEDSDQVDLNAIVNLNSGDTLYACAPMTAFNEFLRIGVEYGVIAMLLSFYIMIRAVVVLIRKGTPLGYGLLSLFIISHFSYPHCFSAYDLLLSVFLGAAGSLDCQLTKNGLRYLPCIEKVIEVLFLGTILNLEMPQIRERQRVDDMERDIAFFFRNQEYSVVCKYCEEKIDNKFLNSNLLYGYGVSLSMMGQYEKSDSILRAGASRSSNPVFWHEIGNNYVRSSSFDRAEEAYIRSFMMVPNRMTPLLYLAQLYHSTGDKEKLERIAAFSETFQPKVPSYTTKQYHETIKQLANEE